MQFRNGIFIITEENECPLYNVGEELRIREGILALPIGKPTCLTLTNELIAIATDVQNFEYYSEGSTQKNKFECGGCTGVIRFEYKKDKIYATIQMRLLASAERRALESDTGDFADMLRKLDIFSSLSNLDIFDLAQLLEQKDFHWQFPIILEGDPGNKLYILLSGKAEVVDENGVILAELLSGDVFGEMSLLTGERANSTIIAAEPSSVAIMNQKNFRYILNRFPTLQIFFYKLLVNRITKMNVKRAEELSSGMVGQTSDISPVELCQMINANQKTGSLRIEFGDERAEILFNEGEIVSATVGNTDGREAFFNSLLIDDGRFTFTQGLESSKKKLEVLGGFMSLLMEGMKYLDDIRDKQ